MKHELTPCADLGMMHQQFHTKSYSGAFQCGSCGLQRRFNLNFLGSRRVPMCDGEQIKAGEKLSYDDYRKLKSLADANKA